MDLSTLARRYDKTRGKAVTLKDERNDLYAEAVDLYEAKAATAQDLAGALGVSMQRWWQILKQVRAARGA